MKALGASEASSNAWCPSLHPGTWKDSSAATVFDSLLNCGSHTLSFLQLNRLTLLFAIIGLCFKQQPGWWSTCWGYGRPKFNTLLTLRGSIKHFPTLQKTVLNYKTGSQSLLLCYLSAVETAVTQVRAQIKSLCKSLWLQSSLKFLGISVANNKVAVFK